MPKVSVLMTSYNTDSYIEEAIQSILKQTYTDFELIIVDDASADNSWNIITHYQKQNNKIRCYKNNNNLGISQTRNKLIDLAQWEYIAWLDSDDKAKHSRLKKQTDFLNTHPDHGIVWSWMTLIDNTWKVKWIKKLPVDDREIRKQWYIRNSLNQTGLMIRKSCIEKTGYYNIDMDPAEDYDFYVRAWIHCLLANIPENLTCYRIHLGNTSLKKHKITIQKTLLIRKKMIKLGYKIWILWYIAYPMTWCMQFVPPRISLFLFHCFIKLFSVKKNLSK